MKGMRKSFYHFVGSLATPQSGRARANQHIPCKQRRENGIVKARRFILKQSTCAFASSAFSPCNNSEESKLRLKRELLFDARYHLISESFNRFIKLLY